MISPNLIWFIVSLLFLVIELGHPGLFFFLSFAGGAMLTAGVSTIIPLSFQLQGLIFLVGSLSYFMLFKLVIKPRLMRGTSQKTNVDAMIGKRAVVIEAITPQNPGLVKIYGDIWRAKAYHDIQVGREVEIIKVGGAHVIVKEI